MNIGFNLLLWTPALQEDQFHLLSSLKNAGYDGVELPIFSSDPAHYKVVGKALADQGLRSTAVTVVPDEAHNPSSPVAANRAGAVDFLKGIVDSCHAAGTEILMGPYHQPLGVFTGNGPTSDEWQWAAEVHREVADHAQQAGVKLVIEWLNRFECYLISTMAQGAEYAALVNHPNFTTMFDTFHANIEEKDPAATLRKYIKSVGHVHISENDRGTPGTGHAAIRESIQVLKEEGYTGWLTIEAFGRALPELAAATRVWRDLFPSPEEVYTKGIAYIRECLK
ncbi:sugar phosphate isomerase/epimerase family protein [Luteolibacter soli]|uniref:Sugar phosphate isomerase/epimerase family protein n=1 Tax=Luteolibacter soli TaxID=3135280 RepID=A0ABU9AT25_9BACT